MLLCLLSVFLLSQQLGSGVREAAVQALCKRGVAFVSGTPSCLLWEGAASASLFLGFRMSEEMFWDIQSKTHFPQAKI